MSFYLRDDGGDDLSDDPCDLNDVSYDGDVVSIPRTSVWLDDGDVSEDANCPN